MTNAEVYQKGKVVSVGKGPPIEVWFVYEYVNCSLTAKITSYSYAKDSLDRLQSVSGKGSMFNAGTEGRMV